MSRFIDWSFGVMLALLLIVFVVAMFVIAMEDKSYESPTKAFKDLCAERGGKVVHNGQFRECWTKEKP